MELHVQFAGTLLLKRFPKDKLDLKFAEKWKSSITDKDLKK